MKTGEIRLGEKLSAILIKPNTDYQDENNQYLADELIFSFETIALHILPIEDSDEISLITLRLGELMKDNDFVTLSELDRFNEKRLSVIWNCVNTSGYLDLLALGFSYLHPSLLILSEGGVLKLFDVTRIVRKRKTRKK